MKKLKKFLQESLRIGINKCIPVMNESLRIGINDKPESTMDDALKIYNILDKNLKRNSDTIFFDDEFIDVKNILESMYEYCFSCVGKERTKDIMQILDKYEQKGFSTQFINCEYIKGATSVELYELKLEEENYIRDIFTSLDFDTIDTKNENIKFNIHEDDKMLLCGIVQEHGGTINIDEILIVLK